MRAGQRTGHVRPRPYPPTKHTSSALLPRARPPRRLHRELLEMYDVMIDLPPHPKILIVSSPLPRPPPFRRDFVGGGCL